jgi:hypothetical protein
MYHNYHVLHAVARQRQQQLLADAAQARLARQLSPDTVKPAGQQGLLQRLAARLSAPRAPYPAQQIPAQG